MLEGVAMRQTELRLMDEDRALVEEIRSKGLHHAREVNRAHVLSALDRGVPEAQIMAVLDMGRTPGTWHGKREPRDCATHAKKGDLKPWRKLMWCIGRLTEAYRSGMYALLELNARPMCCAEPDICIDEKSSQLVGHFCNARLTRGSRLATSRSEPSRGPSLARMRI